MQIPKLRKSDRDKEYNSYSPFLRAQVTYGYLFEGLSHRILDTKYLNKDGNISRGWQSMGILHFLGLTAEHKNIFSELSIDSAISFLQNDNIQNYIPIIEHLKILQSKKPSNMVELLSQHETEVAKSLKDSAETRKKRLISASKKPKPITVQTTVLQRNPDVVAEVLLRADGICEECKLPAPFFRKKDNSPYLEVHHLIPLSSDGDDSVENAVALCPNCHRKMHFG